MSRTLQIAFVLLFIAAATSAAAKKHIKNKAPQRLERQTNPQATSMQDYIRQANEQAAKNIELYRRMWERMTPEQRNEMIRRGGPTLEQYERMLQSPRLPPQDPAATGPSAPKPSASGPAAPDFNRGANAEAIDSLRDSMRDLDSIRDANVGRVQKDVCPPEMAARIADLRTQIQRQEAELKGEIPPGQPAKPRPVVNPLDTAANWFKTPEPSPTGIGSAKDRLIDSVLPNAGSGERREPRAEPASHDPEAGRKTLEQVVARSKAELEQLLGACAATKR